MKFDGLKQLNLNRKKPEQARAVQTVEAIFEATAQLVERGENATTNRIAEHAGVSIGSIYQYFPNGTAILAAMAERERGRVSEAIKGVLETLDPGDPEPAIRLALRALLDAFSSRQKLRRKILLSLLPVYAAEVHAHFLESVIVEISEVLRRRAQGRFRPLDGTAELVLGGAVLGAVRSAVLSEKQDLGDPLFEDELVRLVVGFLMIPADDRPACSAG